MAFFLNEWPFCHFYSILYFIVVLVHDGEEHTHLSIIVKLVKPIYPFLSYRCFLTPLQQTTFWKQGEKRRNCSKQAISFCPHVLHSILLLYFHLKGVKKKKRVCFQSHLLQNWCLRERVYLNLAVIYSV